MDNISQSHYLEGNYGALSTNQGKNGPPTRATPTNSYLNCFHGNNSVNIILYHAVLVLTLRAERANYRNTEQNLFKHVE